MLSLIEEEDVLLKNGNSLSNDEISQIEDFGAQGV